MTGGALARGARNAAAPARDYFNSHFEMVKHEIRLAGASRSGLDHGISELEVTIAESTLHQARAIAKMRDDLDAVQASIAELERIVTRLADVVAASTLTPVDPAG